MEAVVRGTMPEEVAITMEIVVEILVIVDSVTIWAIAQVVMRMEMIILSVINHDRMEAHAFQTMTTMQIDIQ